MKIFNIRNEEIQESECDLNLGVLVPSQILKADVTPIDNVTKFAWGKEDFEDVMLYVVLCTQEDYTEQRIEELKSKLAATDYVVIKIAEGAATADEYAAVIADREAWRKEINELEEQLTVKRED